MLLWGKGGVLGELELRSIQGAQAGGAWRRWSWEGKRLQH